MRELTTRRPGRATCWSSDVGTNPDWDRPGGLNELTPRERDVVRGIIDGRTNREIGNDLGLTEQAVRNVLSTIYGKFHVRSRLELGLLAVRSDLLAR
jgi:two-component system, NarL family, nitrate/nitrite response regulator NarL